MNEDSALDELAARSDDVLRFRQTLTPESDRACGLMAAEYLDQQLKELITAFLVDDSSLVEDEFLAHSRPLGSFSVRIDMAYLLGLVAPAIRRDLHLIRKIRNDFGHHIEPIDFEHPPIAARCRELTNHILAKTDPPRRLYMQATMGVLGAIHSQLFVTRHLAKAADHSWNEGEKTRFLQAFMARFEQFREDVRRIVGDQEQPTPAQWAELHAAKARFLDELQKRLLDAAGAGSA